MPILSEQEIVEIRARNEARTKGKWAAIGPCVVGILAEGQTLEEEAYDVIPITFIADDDCPANHKADYDFIAGCSEDVLNLFDTLDARDERIRELEEALRFYGEKGTWVIRKEVEELGIVDGLETTQITYYTVAEKDGGERARKALGEQS